MSGPKYKGEASDHFDGKQFLNYGGIKANELSKLLRWGFNRKPDPWPDYINEEPGPPPPQRVSKGVKITFVNHATFLIQIEGINILTDPVWSDRASPFTWAGPQRKRLPGINFEDLPPIDLVLLSHNHYDHLDLPTLKKLTQQHNLVIYHPLGVGLLLQEHQMNNLVEMDWWDKESSGPIEINCVPAQHFSSRGLGDRDATLWSGFVIKSNIATIFFAGDTGYGDFFQQIKDRFKPIDISLLPIGAYKPNWFMKPIHMSPAEAVQAHLDLESGLSIPIHYGTFPLADDGYETPLQDLNIALQNHSIDPQYFPVVKEGSSLDYQGIIVE